MSALSDSERPDPLDRGRWPDPGEPTPYGTNWAAKAADYAQTVDGTTSGEPLPGPVPAAALRVPPAYRVWAPAVVEAADPGAA